jgi:hypothetical protein
MWIYTRDGFVSVRASALDPMNVVCRFRTRKHAQAFADRCKVNRVVTTDDTDYRYRFEVSRGVLAGQVAAEIALLDYSNFKAAVSAAGDDVNYVAALHETWFVHHEMQQKERVTQQ